MQTPPPNVPAVPVPVDPSPPLDIEVQDQIPTSVSVVDTATIPAEENDHPAEIPDGNPNAYTDVEMGSDFIGAMLGAGGGDSGKIGQPDGGGGPARVGINARKKSVKRLDPKIVMVAENALRWFKKHQSPNGMWDVDGYQLNCGDAGGRCEPGTEHVGADGDVACTAYAVMCFLGAGYDHHTGTYRNVVKHGLDFLLSVQKADGSFGDRNYEHAIATMAIADACAMSEDRALREPAQRGVAVILARQNRDAKDGAYGLGWDYAAPNRTRNDSSVTGWNVMALKSALGAGLDVGNGLVGARNWLDQAWRAANPGWVHVDPYQGRTVFPYTFDPIAGTTDRDHLAAVGAVCSVFLGHHLGDPMLESLINHIMDTDYPKSVAWPTNTYLLYYNTMALFQATSGGNDARWKRWNEPVRNMLITSQRADRGCFEGSWDFAGTGFPGHDVGRLLSTAYCCLSAEVYYRKELVQRVR
ncbi:MAG: terpene cyclase/mutase family protein [Planctomycetes bacterium]|nr:terpene cyclase/mutase family protein [Planctomycetota bacterium]